MDTDIPAVWPDPETEKAMLADAFEAEQNGSLLSAEYQCAQHIRALLARIRLLERGDEIMRRRGLTPVQCNDGRWAVLKNHLAMLVGGSKGTLWHGDSSSGVSAADPRAALIAADDWLTEQEGKP